MKGITLHDIFAVEYSLKSGDFIASMYSGCFIRSYSHKIYLDMIAHLRDYFKVNKHHDKCLLTRLKKQGSVQVTRQLQDAILGLTYCLMYYVRTIKAIILN